VLNFLILIGWNPGEGEEQEIFTREEMINRFTIERITNASGIYSQKKLDWMNGMYLRKLPVTDFIERTRPFITAAGLTINQERYKIIAPFVQERMKHLVEAPEMLEFLFKEEIHRDFEAMFQKDINLDVAKKILALAKAKISAITEYTVANLEAALRALADELGLKPGPAFGVVRIAVTGKKVTPPLFESLFALGKDTTLTRLDQAYIELSNRSA
jgi:glutamyl-tRNA synthetase